MSVSAPARSVSTSYLSPFKAAHHLDGVHALRNGLLIPPRNIQIDLEAFCPHSCEFCSYRNVGWQDYKPAPMLFDAPTRVKDGISGMPWEIAQNIPWQMKQAGIPAIEITGGGESLVYPHIHEFLAKLSAHEIEVGLVTNGVALNRKMRDWMDRGLTKWVRFSCDAIDADTYEKVHRTPKSAFATLIRNIRDLAEWRYAGETLIGISFVITKHNYGQIAEAAQFYRDLGADSIRFTFTFTPEGDGALSEEARRMALSQMAWASRLSSESFKVFTVNRLDAYNDPNTDFTQCGYQHFVWAIGFDGKVYPCCIMKYHAGYVIGDLAQQTLEDIVHSNARKAFARSLIVSQCKPCYLRDKNKFIEYLLDPAPVHHNFV